MARGSFARRLVVAGTVVWVARWALAQSETKPAPIEVPEDLPEAAAAPAAPAGPRHGFRRRLATSLVVSVLFGAGAAFTAGAGNQLAKIDDSSTPAPTVAVDEAAVPALADAAPSDATPVDAAPVDAVAPVEAAPATSEPAPADDSADVVTLHAGAPAVAAAPITPTTAAAPAPTPAARLHTAAPRHARRAVAARVTPVQAPLAPVPFEAIAFNPQAWLHANPASPMGASAVAIAEHYLGVPYRWGGAVPASGFDCSGLTRFVYAQLGINLPHYAAYQFADFAKLDPADLQPGDLVFFEPKFDGPGHVALYVGDDLMIEAPHTGALVRISSFSRAAAVMGFLGAVRPYGDAVAPVPPRLSSLVLRPD